MTSVSIHERPVSICVSLVQASVAELTAFKQKMSDRDIAVQNAAKKQLADVNAQVADLVQRLDAAVGDLDAVKRQADEETSQLTTQLAKVSHTHQHPSSGRRTLRHSISAMVFHLGMIPPCVCQQPLPGSCNVRRGCTYQQHQMPPCLSML